MGVAHLDGRDEELVAPALDYAVIAHTSGRHVAGHIKPVPTSRHGPVPGIRAVGCSGSIYCNFAGCNAYYV